MITPAEFERLVAKILYRVSSVDSRSTIPEPRVVPEAVGLSEAYGRGLYPRPVEQPRPIAEAVSDAVSEAVYLAEA